MRRLVRGVGSGIGLASEAIAHRKASKSPAGRDSSGEQQSGLFPPDQSAHDRALSGGEDGSSDSDVEENELDWELDEAAEQAESADKKERGLEQPPEYSETASVDELVQQFVANHPPPAYSPPPGNLSCPVILPQKRPQTKSRGFVQAYAPMLADCGIDQATFLEFLNDFDRSTHSSQYLTVINVAAQVAGFVPSPIAMGVSIGVQVAVGTAQAIQERYRTNSFLDQMNEKLFRPHGLFCMLITYKPDAASSSEPIMISNFATRAMTPADSKFKQQLKGIRLTSGVSKGELEIPESAPLIYPALDKAATSGEEGKKSSFVADYMDRRAQATYAYKNPDSKLAVPEQPKFVSRYSDPNHPASSGSLIALVTGGHIDPVGRKRRRKAARQDRRRARRGEAPLTEGEKRRGRKKGLIGRILTQDVLYMCIVNMPSQEELDAAIGASRTQSHSSEKVVP